jgi:hypothetical protein
MKKYKFSEEKDLAVYTTRQHLELNKPIIHVVHDSEGEWQFLTGDQIQSDIRIVGLGQMIERDNSLNEIYNLNYGQQAVRKKIGEPWARDNIVD